MSLYFSYRVPLQVTIREHTIFKYTELNKSISACCLLTVHRTLVNIFRHRLGNEMGSRQLLMPLLL